MINTIYIYKADKNDLGKALYATDDKQAIDILRENGYKTGLVKQIGTDNWTEYSEFLTITKR